MIAAACRRLRQHAAQNPAYRPVRHFSITYGHFLRLAQGFFIEREAVSQKFQGGRPQRLLKIRANNLNYILRCFFGGFRILRHVVDDVIFHEFAHQAVDGTAGSSEAPKNLRALLIVIQSFKNRLELSDNFFGSIHQIQLFSRGVRHFA
jgi:hypothetical protein